MPPAFLVGMTVITVLVVLLVVGVAMYLIGLIPMDGRILMAIRALVLLIVIVWLLSLFFDFDVPVGHVRHIGRC